MPGERTGDVCQTNDPNNLSINDSNNLFPSSIESVLRLPLDSTMRILFTGYYNGFGVEIHSPEEMALLYHMGCFGKGSASRSRPRLGHNTGRPTIMRKRQFLKRSFWHKKFGGPKESAQEDKFLKDVESLTDKIVADVEKEANRDVIDLVSSDEDITEVETDVLNQHSIENQDNSDMVVIVPNSDSEGENYFENFKPKCCVNKTKLQEKLMLTLQEAFFLTYGLGCLQVFNTESKLLTVEECWQLFTGTHKNFIPKYVAYHYFRSKGYIVKSGIKFGGDYLVYKDGPGVNHADFIVVIKSEDDETISSWTTTLGHVRMASTTVKEILIAEVIKNKESEEKAMPQGLSNYSVREILLTRNIPLTINDDID